MQEVKFRSKDDKLLATMVPASIFVDGLRFLTPMEYPLQVGLIQPKGGDRKVEAHRHRNFDYDVKTTQELIYVIKGEVDAVIYDDDFNKAGEIVLKTGDSLLQVAGGHKFNIKKGSRLLEVKQGPYPGDDKAKIYKDN